MDKNIAMQSKGGISRIGLDRPEFSRAFIISDFPEMAVFIIFLIYLFNALLINICFCGFYMF